MKINLTPADLTRLQHLIDVKDTNIQVADMYLYYLLEQPLSINPTTRKEKYQSIKDDKVAFYRALMDVLGIDPLLDENQKLAQVYFYDGICKLDPKPFIANPYYQAIRPLVKKQGKWSFRYLTYQAYQGFAYDDIKVDSVDYRELSPIGFFVAPYDYLTIYEKNTLWMSLIPHEIKTMEEPLTKMKGDIVVLGLGLGYFSYMAALKEEVTSITIVEKDPDVITLFKENLLPLFEHKNKITIVQEDAFMFLQRTQQKFDTAFCDIWLGANDGLLPYLRLKKLEKKHPATLFTYWLEPSLLAYFRRLVLILIEETMEGFPKDAYQKAKTDEDQIIISLYHLLENKGFTNYEEIHDFLSNSSLKTLAKKLNF